MAKRIEAQDILSPEVKKQIDELKKSVADLNKEVGTLTKTVVSAKKEFDNQSKSQSDLKKKTEDVNAVQKELERIQKAGEKVTKETILASEQLAAKRAKLREEVRKENAELQKNKTFTEKLTGAVKDGAAKFALMLGAITGIVTGMAKFGKALINSNDALQDKWAKAMTVAREVTDSFFDAIAKGNLREFVANMGEIADAAKEYAEAMDEVGDRTRSLTLQEKIANISQQANLKILKDRTKTEAERIAAGQEYLETEKKNAAVRTDIAKQMVDETLEMLKAKGITEEAIRTNLINYEVNRNLIKQADEYNKALSEKAAFEKAAGQGQNISGSIKYAQALNAVANADSKVVEMAKLRVQYSDLNEAKMDELTKIFGDLFDAQASFDERTQRAASTVSGLMQQQKEEAEAAAKANAEKLKSQQELNSEKAKEAALQSEIDSKRAANDLIINQNLLTRIEYQQNTTTAEKEYIDEIFLAYQELHNKKAEWTAEEQAMYDEALQDLKSMTIDTFNGLFDLRENFRDSEIASLEKQRDYEVALAKQKGQDTANIEKKFADKEKELRRKNAVNEKLQRIFNSSITIAEGIIKYASNPITAVLAPAFAALGALQLGMIIATPIPKFFKGGTAPGGPVIVGDKPGAKGQRELVMLPNGEGFITPNMPTALSLPRGSKIFPEHSPQTQAAMKSDNGESLKYLKSIDSKLSGRGNTPLLTKGGLEWYNERTNTRVKQLKRWFS